MSQFQNRRQTSSGRNPHECMKDHVQLAKQRAAKVLKKVIPNNDWGCIVKKFSHCTIKDHDGGRGLQTVWEVNSKGKDKESCMMRCHGDETGLTIKIVVAKSRLADGRALKELTIPDADTIMDLRTFDTGRLIEFRTIPKVSSGRGKEKALGGDLWAVQLFDELEPEYELQRTKRMMRRLESVTLQMPREWIRERRYWPLAPRAQSAIRGNPDALVYHLGGGITLRYSGGCLTSPAAKRALGWEAEKLAPPLDGDGIMTRAACERWRRQAQSVSSTDGDTLQGQCSKGKKSKRLPAKARRRLAVTNRSRVAAGLIPVPSPEVSAQDEDDALAASDLATIFEDVALANDDAGPSGQIPSPAVEMGEEAMLLPSPSPPSLSLLDEQEGYEVSGLPSVIPDSIEGSPPPAVTESIESVEDARSSPSLASSQPVTCRLRTGVRRDYKIPSS